MSSNLPTGKFVGRVSPIGRNPTDRSQVSVSEHGNVGLRCANPTYGAEPKKPLLFPLFADTVQSEWLWRRLDEIADVYDCPHSTPKLIDNNNAPFVVRSQDVRTGTFMVESAARVSLETYQDRVRRVEPRFGDLLYSREGTYFGIAAEVPKGIKVCLGQRMVLIRPKAEQVSHSFLKYWLNSPQVFNHIHGFRDGTVAERLNLPVIRGLSVAFPSLTEHYAIAETLTVLDDRIALLRETNATLEAIAQALFKSWFVDFDPVHAKQQGHAPEGMSDATAALFPDSFEESKLGLVPKGWRISTMDDVSAVGIGKTPPRKEAHWFSESPSDVRWVSIRDMGTSGTFISQTSEYLTTESIERFNVRQVPDNTVLLSFKMTIGRVALTDGEMTTNEAIAHFKLNNQSHLSSEFIYLHLKQFDYSSLSSTSSIADAVNSKTVKAIPILVPDKTVLLAFQELIRGVFNRIKMIQQQAQTLATLRDTLLPRLISGQLRLPDDNTSHG
jgi:type I restriction enzyme S subunit